MTVIVDSNVSLSPGVMLMTTLVEQYTCIVVRVFSHLVNKHMDDSHDVTVMILLNSQV